MKVTKTYNLKTVLVTVGAVSVGGYGEDGGVVVEWDSDLFEVTVGADGETVHSRINNDNAKVTITVLETSQAYNLLSLSMQTQIAEVDSGLGLLPKVFAIVDPATGDGLVSAYATFLNRPGMAKNKKPGNREFRLALTTPLAVYGAANLV